MGDAAPMVPATAKGEATRAYLLRTAAVVFAEHGYAATTMAQLIDACGLTKGAFYFYFRSKAELALAVLAEQKTRFLDRVAAALAGRERAVDELLAMVPVMVELIERDPAAWSVTRLARELAAEPELTTRVREPMTAWVALLAGVVRRAQAEGDLRAEVDADALAAVLVAAFDGLRSLTDVLRRPGASALFAERARVLVSLVDLALCGGRGAAGSPASLPGPRVVPVRPGG
ncbi:TetR/AcrR family transcriptional regulator [Frankia sp. QA3]|uniref:TetR/AcrR family transcriptional regulator n=1 Tax=Frankia sp. QA3 TaxID=710111 RepID=UPI000269BBED|nr:TetR/AcrR family transcriptional regulator [Frankia sp. QA3]EIV92190.1 transcriptional regulator [Frankia sp. QA3]